MIIAHAPAGYLLYRSLPQNWQTKAVLWTTIIGSIAPDFDFIFNILGLSSSNHRFFVTHTPLFWVLLYLSSLGITNFLDKRPYLVHGFFLGTLSHIALDIPTGIRVLYPLSDTVTNWFPLVYGSQLSVMEHLMHPYVLAEIGIWGLAIGLFVQRRLHKNISKYHL